MGQLGIRSFSAAIVAGVALLLAGCIKDGLSDCARETDIYISVSTDGYWGVSVPAEEATVFLFDRNQRYLESIPISKQQIDNREPISIPVTYGDKAWAVVWANLASNESVGPLTPGQEIQQAFVDLTYGADGYANPLDGLYYGIKQLTGENDNEVVISPKTARIAITVRGLADTDAEYYFTISEHYGGYDFSGTPYVGDITMKLDGEFGAGGDLTTPTACHIIHYPTKVRTAERQYATIELWKTEEGGDRLLVSIDKDSDSAPLFPQAGKTLNTLIYFTEGGSIEVTVVVTEWNEVYQWNEW